MPRRSCSCGALARSSELFADATSKAHVVLSAPFDEYAEADVARFLSVIYRIADAPDGAAASADAVVRLAHALDAPHVLAAACAHLAGELPAMSHKSAADALALAELCGWEELVDIAARELVGQLLNPSASALDHRISDVDAHIDAAMLVEQYPISLVTAVLGTLMAAVRRTTDSAAAALLLLPDVAEARRAAAGGALEYGGRFVALLQFDASDWRPGGRARARFRSHDLEWELAAGRAAEGGVRVDLHLHGGSMKRVAFEVGLVHLHDPVPDFSVRRKEVLSNAAGDGARLAPPDFDDPETGWWADGSCAVFAEILEVADAAPAGRRAGGRAEV
jgi:hypothetical protein